MKIIPNANTTIPSISYSDISTVSVLKNIRQMKMAAFKSDHFCLPRGFYPQINNAYSG